MRRNLVAQGIRLLRVGIPVLHFLIQQPQLSLLQIQRLPQFRHHRVQAGDYVLLKRGLDFQLCDAVFQLLNRVHLQHHRGNPAGNQQRDVVVDEGRDNGIADVVVLPVGVQPHRRTQRGIGRRRTGIAQRPAVPTMATVASGEKPKPTHKGT